MKKLFLVIVVLLACVRAWACEDSPTDVPFVDAYKKAKNVFVFRVKSAVLKEGLELNSEYRYEGVYASIEIIRVLRGAPETDTVHYSVSDICAEYVHHLNVGDYFIAAINDSGRIAYFDNNPRSFIDVTDIYYHSNSNIEKTLAWVEKSVEDDVDRGNVIEEWLQREKTGVHSAPPLAPPPPPITR